MMRKSVFSRHVFNILLFFAFFAIFCCFSAETGKLYINARDLKLSYLESFLNTRSAGIEYEGKIDISANLIMEEGTQVLSDGVFSSDKVSFSAENFLFPLECFQLQGEFALNSKDSQPSITGSLRSDSVTWGSLYARNFKADYIFEGKNLIIKGGELEISDGTVKVDGDIDFSKSPAAFNLKFIVEGVDIGDISQRWGYARPIAGILFADADFSGTFGKPTGFFGKAKINIEEGELGKVGWVGRMLTLSPFAALSRDFSLTSFDGDFNIAEGYAHTDNAELKGPGIRISAKGEAGWNKKIDFLLGLHASSELLGGTALTRAFGGIMDEFGNVLRRIKLTGTIDNPSFTILPLGIGEAIVEGLERTFQRGKQEEDLK